MLCMLCVIRSAKPFRIADYGRSSLLFSGSLHEGAYYSGFTLAPFPELETLETLTTKP